VYYTSGFDECLTNLVVLASTHSQKPVGNGQDLAAGFRAFVLATNARPVPPGPLHLVADEARLRTLVRQFRREPTGTDVRALAAPAESVALFWDGLELLPEPAQTLFRLVVAEVALFDGTVVASGSGAMVEQLGTIYVAPEPWWRAEDVAECLTHEMTHLLLRCDEHRFGHYVDPVDAIREQEFGPTAVSLTLRSPMVVFHSLIVAAEIMGLRIDLRAAAERQTLHAPTDRHGAHGPDRLLVERALQCADEVLHRSDRNRHYSERAVILMERATARLQSALPAKVG
jgi:hypothetical protein